MWMGPHLADAENDTLIGAVQDLPFNVAVTRQSGNCKDDNDERITPGL